MTSIWLNPSRLSLFLTSVILVSSNTLQRSARQKSGLSGVPAVLISPNWGLVNTWISFLFGSIGSNWKSRKSPCDFTRFAWVFTALSLTKNDGRGVWHTEWHKNDTLKLNITLWYKISYKDTKGLSDTETTHWTTQTKRVYYFEYCFICSTISAYCRSISIEVQTGVWLSLSSSM